MQDNARVQRRDDANFAQKSREKLAKIPEIRNAPRTKIACIRPACAAHAAQRRYALNERARNTFKSEKESVQRRDHANFAPNSREKNFEVSEKFRRAARTKVA